MAAAGEGNERVFELLLNWPLTDVNAHSNGGKTALMFAAGAGRLQHVRRLVEAGAHIEAAHSPMNAVRSRCGCAC